MANHPAIVMEWYELGDAKRYVKDRPELLFEDRSTLVRNIICIDNVAASSQLPPGIWCLARTSISPHPRPPSNTRRPQSCKL